MAEKKVTETKSATEVVDDGKVTVYIPKEPGVKVQTPVYVNANGRTVLQGCSDVRRFPVR